MNWDRVEGNWKELKGRVHEQWGRLTYDEVEVIAGRREQLEGTLQRIYGKSKDEVRREVEDFCRTCSCGD
jgi:uncharacterized protein YjbJ (UPF0337 family)